MRLSWLIFPSFLFCSVLSCSETDPEPEPDPINCNLIELSRDNPYLKLNYTYDTQHRIVELLWEVDERFSKTSFSYSETEVNISASESSEDKSKLDLLTPTFTMKFNADGLPLSGISPDQTHWVKFFYKDDLLDYYYERYSNGTADSATVTYDGEKKNLVKAEYFRLDKEQKVVSRSLFEYTYDDKVNPYYGKYRYNDGIDPLQFFSVNNLILWGSSTFSYVYNEHNYPIERIRRSSYGGDDRITTYIYQCD